jgi:LCP family protein required for cell wall assembly
VFALLALQLDGGPTVFAARLLNPSFSLTLLILIFLLGAWRILSIVDAGVPGAGAGRVRGRPGAIVAALLVAVVGMHAVAASVAYSFYAAGSNIFVGDSGDPDQAPEPSSGEAEPSDHYNVPPFETPATITSRITLLLTGIDKTIDRSHSLTDTLLVVSIDVESKSITMVSFPRDIAQFPLYGGGTYPGKINSLMTAAATDPDRYPDGPLPTLAKELGFLLGLPINYFAAVDLDGFQKMIAAVGGVTVNVDRAIADPAYDWLDGSPRGFYLAAGPQKLDPRTALAFVRSRLGVGDNDFTRAARQQQLLVALRSKLTDPGSIGSLPDVLRAAGESIRTNFPPERLDEMITVAEDIGLASVERVVLQPPTYSVHPPTNTTGGTYILRLHEDAVRALSVRLFGDDSAFWTGTFDPSGVPIPEPVS